MQELGVALPALLRTLTAACQNDYNCKAVVKQDTQSLAAGLLFDSSSEVAFETLCLMYTLTTESDARLAVGGALVRATSPTQGVPVSQLFTLMAAGNAGTACAEHLVLQLCCDDTGTIMQRSRFLCIMQVHTISGS